jgi:hypothetical protein
LTSNGSQGIHLLTRQSGVEICDRFSAEHEPLYKLCRVLFERITEAVVNLETDDWPRYYDRLSALICKVITKSDLSTDAKCVLTRRLIQRVAELEKWWPRLQAK